MTATSNDKVFWMEFIELYRENTALWRLKSKEYSDKGMKNRGYDVLVDKLREKDPTATRETVAKKINNLRSCFRKETKKVEASRRSGASPEDLYVPALWYYDLLLFLKDQETPRSPAHSNMDEEVTSEEFAIGQSPRNDTEFPIIGTVAGNIPPKSSSPVPKKIRLSSVLHKSESIMPMRGEHLMSPLIEDTFDLLGKQIALKLRGLTSTKTQLIAEKLINEVLYEAQMENLTENTILTKGDHNKPPVFPAYQVLPLCIPRMPTTELSLSSGSAQGVPTNTSNTLEDTKLEEMLFQ